MIISSFRRQFLPFLLVLTAIAHGEDPAVTIYPNGTGVRNLYPAPPPGIHPRIFLSPEDLPALREAVKSPARRFYYAQLQKEVAEKLDNPSSPAGKVMALISSGKTPDDSQFAAASDDMNRQLALAGIDCIIKNDSARGKVLGRVLNAWGAYELTHWVRMPDPVGTHNSFDPEICLAYDFIAPWMPEDQRVPVRQFIAKMSDGIHIYTWDMPPRWRMWNWAALHVFQGWGSLAIEGEPGYTPQLWNEARMVVRDIGRYNIHPSGALTEDLTYFTLGFEGTGPVMIAMAKRGEQDVWATSNLRALKYHLLNQLYPWGGSFQSHADGVGSGFYTSFAIWKYMYPQDPIFDYTWRNRVGEDYTNGGAGNDSGIRTWVVTLFGTEHFQQQVKAADLGQPLFYFSPERGYLIARTSWEPDAVKLDFEAKQDYPIVGHNHADPNNFNLDALGREWVTDTGYHAAGGNQHNEVIIDGVPESPWPCPGGKWIDLVNTPDAVIGVSDARHAYTYHWSNTGYTVDNNPPNDKEEWEKETDPRVMAFYAGQEHRQRTGIFDHYSPFLLRSVWNPVQRAFRTASLVRGAHPYVFIVDDIRKDNAPHLYEWIQQMPDDVEILRSGSGYVVLGAKMMPADPKDKDSKPVPDNRRLLVQVVDADTSDHSNAMAIRLEDFLSGLEPYDGQLRKRLTIPARGVDPRFKVLLYPFMEDQELPIVAWNDEHTQCRFIWKDQEDRYTFGSGEAGRTVYTLERAGKQLAMLTAAPPAPKLLSTERVFTSACRLELENPGPAEEIHYTLDGSEPSIGSHFYDGPFTITQSAKLKAATFARRWAFGPKTRSVIIDATFTRQVPLAAITNPPTSPGLRAAIFRGYWDNLPDLSGKPMVETAVERFVLPPETPAKGFGARLSGLLNVPETGVYTFALRCDDAGKLWVDNREVVNADGPHVVKITSGQIALAAGWHRIAAANCDNALPHGKGKGDGSWAFQVLWAPPDAGGLAEIPPMLLAQDAADAVEPKMPAAVAGVDGMLAEPGLDYALFDRTRESGRPDFFQVAGAKPINTGAVPWVTTPDSAEGLLHVYKGFIRIPHAGLYQFALSTSGIGEISIGDQVVNRVGLADLDASQPVRLSEGFVPVTFKLAKGSGLIQWKGPGMDWQSIESEDYARPARPHIVFMGRDSGHLEYEVIGSQPVLLAPPAGLDGAIVRYTLDGSRPAPQSAAATGPITIDHTCTLRACAYKENKAAGDECTAAFLSARVPAENLIGLWSPAQMNEKGLVNQIPAGPDMPIPHGTPMVDDHGKALQFNESPRITLDHPGILANEISLAFWIKPAGSCTLVHTGYAHFGFFLELENGGGLRGGGGGNWDVLRVPGSGTDNQWRHVTLTIGGRPFREMKVYVDGKLAGSGQTKAPCIAQQIDLLEGFSGLLSEVRLYNRALDSDEVLALAKAQP